MELFFWYLSGFEVNELYYGMRNVLIFGNFFWLKVFEGLYYKGFIDKINYIDFFDLIEKKLFMEEESKWILNNKFF